MIFSSRRAACALPLLIGLAIGCASGRGGREPVDASTVTAEDIEKRPGQPIEKVLQAQVPGVLVTRTADGGIAVQIRGSSPFSGDNAPLYLLNGAPFEPGPDGAIPVNPYEIDTIKVLKGAEAGLYGIQGSNGVILITTKKPGK